MPKVFLLRVFAYRSDCDNMANIWSFKSILFNDMKSAVKTGKQILKEQLKELFKTDRFKYAYRNLEEFIKYERNRIDYVFEVQETDMSKLKAWKHEDILKKCGDLSIPEELAKYHNLIIQNPLYICWSYDYKGNLKDRLFCYSSDENRFSGGAWKDQIHDGFSFRPNDEKENAGKKFKLGDIIFENCDESEKKILYVIYECPLKLYKHFYNIYACYYINNGLLDCEIFHEEDISLYDGDVPKNIKWLSKLHKSEIKIDEEDMEKIKKGHYIFSDLASYEQIKIDN